MDDTAAKPAADSISATTGTDRLGLSVAAEEWQGGVNGLVLLIAQACDVVLGDAGLYNATKHGLADRVQPQPGRDHQPVHRQPLGHRQVPLHARRGRVADVAGVPAGFPARVASTPDRPCPNWFGAAAVNRRCTRSGCRAATGSARVVRTRLVRRTPSIPAACISRAT
jgi:hypothetical protein